MQNRTQMLGRVSGGKFGSAVKNHTTLFMHMLAFIGGYFTAGAFIFESIAPFGAAYTAAVSRKYSLSASAGAAVGYLISPYSGHSVKYIAAVLLVYTLRLVFSSAGITKSSVPVPPVTAGIAVGICAGAVAFASPARVDTVLVLLSEIMLAVGSAYFMSRSFALAPDGFAGVGKNDLVGLGVTFAVLMISLSGTAVMGISVGRVLAVVVVLAAARAGGPGAGAAMGIAAGTTCALLGADYGFLMGAYSLAGLAAGLLSDGGRLGVSVAFVLTNAVVSIMSPTNAVMIGVIYEAAVGSVLFTVLPDKLLASLRPKKSGSGPSEEFYRHSVKKKLEFFKEGLTEIYDTTKIVSERLDDMTRASVDDVHDGVAEKVCRRCNMRMNCWQINYDRTMNDINDMISTLKKTGGLSKINVPEHFLGYCQKPDGVILTVQNEYTAYLKKESGKRKAAQVRSVVGDQFEGLAMMVDSLAKSVESIREEKPVERDKIFRYFESAGLDPSECFCYTDEYDRLTAEIIIPPVKSVRLDSVSTTLEISDICGRLMSEPAVRELGGKIIVTFSERAEYAVDWGAHQITEEGSKVSGDRYEKTAPGIGREVVVLSDGMGSGGSAAVDAALTVNLIGNLMHSGAGFDACLKMVNSALLVKSGDESLATVDIADIDLYSGRIKFYKAGAAPTFFIRGGKPGFIESSSLPAGILRGVAFEESHLKIGDGDAIIMVSDGVTLTGSEWLASEISAHAAKPASEMARCIAATALERQPPGRGDDITVVAVKLQKV